MDLLQYILNLKDINRIDNANPISMSAIVKSFQDGEYERCEKSISGYIEEYQVLDIYALFITFSIDLYNNVTALSELTKKLALYENILKEHSENLSPINRFDATLKNGVETFSQVFMLKVTEKREERSSFDVDSLIEVTQGFFDYSASLGNIDIKEFRKANDVIKTLNKIKLTDNKGNESDSETKSITEEPKEEHSNVQSKQVNKASNHSSIEQFASVNWYKFIQKIGMFQLLVKDKRMFEASIVYQDIQSELAKFDPKEYFPGLFFPFYKTLAPNAREIHKFIDRHSNSLQWDIAKNLYDIDRARFLKELPQMVENSMSDEDFIDIQQKDGFSNDRNMIINKDVSTENSDDIEFSDQLEEDYDDNTFDDKVMEGDTNEIDNILNDMDGFWDSE